MRSHLPLITPGDGDDIVKATVCTDAETNNIRPTEYSLVTDVRTGLTQVEMRIASLGI